MDIVPIVGGNGVKYKLVRMPGSMSLDSKIYEGVFEYIIDPDGWINHRFFNRNWAAEEMIIVTEKILYEQLGIGRTRELTGEIILTYREALTAIN